MKKLTSFSAACVFILGCVSHRINLEESRAVTIVERKPEGLYLRTSAYEEDGNTVIQGTLTRGPLNRTRIPGHIDITVKSAAGEELASIKVSFQKPPSRRHGSNPVAFKAELPVTLPNKSEIQVIYDTSEH